MYHCKDGLFFEKLPFGDIRIVTTGDGKPPAADSTNVLFETTIVRSVVASLMAHCCERGYSTESFFRAYEYLKGGPPELTAVQAAG